MGHKNEESIKHYAEMDLEYHKDIGRKISRVTLLEKWSELQATSTAQEINIGNSFSRQPYSISIIAR